MALQKDTRPVRTPSYRKDYAALQAWSQHDSVGLALLLMLRLAERQRDDGSPGLVLRCTVE